MISKSARLIRQKLVNQKSYVDELGPYVALEYADYHIVYFNARRLLDDAQGYIAAVQRFLDQNRQGESE
jgi:hypothetical protein